MIMGKLHYDECLYYTTQHLRNAKKEALDLLKVYIHEHGEIDWTEDEDSQIETTFYCDGYFTAKVIRVSVDEERGLVVYTDQYDYDEFSDAFTNDTLFDILCAVIGNSSIAK